MPVNPKHGAAAAVALAIAVVLGGCVPEEASPTPTPTPSVAAPVAMSSSATRRTTFDGIAKPIPMSPEAEEPEEAIATLIPRHAVAVTVGWMLLVDSSLSALDIPLRHLSTAFAARAIAGFSSAGPASGAITLVVLTGIATGVACWRVGRIE